MSSEQRKASDGRRIYGSGRAPDGLATVKQLSERGLKPGGPPVAYLDLGTADADLFDERNVVPLDADRVRIEMDGATAVVLRDALHGWGEHIAAGVPLPDFTPEENTSLGEVIENLEWHLRRRR
jgi:hypothetical protein